MSAGILNSTSLPGTVTRAVLRFRRALARQELCQVTESYATFIDRQRETSGISPKDLSEVELPNSGFFALHFPTMELLQSLPPPFLFPPFFSTFVLHLAPFSPTVFLSLVFIHPLPLFLFLSRSRPLFFTLFIPIHLFASPPPPPFGPFSLSECSPFLLPYPRAKFTSVSRFTI